MRISQYNNVKLFVLIRIFIVLFLRKESFALLVFFFIFFIEARASSILPAYELFLGFELAGEVDHENSIENIFKAFELQGLATKKEIAQAICAEVKVVYAQMKKTDTPGPGQYNHPVAHEPDGQFTSLAIVPSVVIDRQMRAVKNLSGFRHVQAGGGKGDPHLMLLQNIGAYRSVSTPAIHPDWSEKIHHKQ